MGTKKMKHIKQEKTKIHRYIRWLIFKYTILNLPFSVWFWFGKKCGWIKQNVS